MTKSNIYNSEQWKISKPQNMSDFVIFVQPWILAIFSDFFETLKYIFRIFEKKSYVFLFYML
jgi:hypothetical protein